MTTEAINHDPAHMFMNTGSQIAVNEGRTSSTGRAAATSAYVGTDEDEEADPEAQRRYASAEGAEAAPGKPVSLCASAGPEAGSRAGAGSEPGSVARAGAAVATARSTACTVAAASAGVAGADAGAACRVGNGAGGIHHQAAAPARIAQHAMAN